MYSLNHRAGSLDTPGMQCTAEGAPSDRPIALHGVRGSQGHDSGHQNDEYLPFI